MARARSTEDSGRSPSIRMPFAMRENSAINPLHAVERGFLETFGQQFVAALEMALCERLNIGVEARFVARFGFAERVEQEVSDFRHGRHHDRHRAMLVLFGGETRGHVDAFGRAHAGAPELHHEKMTTAIQ